MVEPLGRYYDRLRCGQLRAEVEAVVTGCTYSLIVQHSEVEVVGEGRAVYVAEH